MKSVSLFDFILPKNLIAKYPLKERDQSKLLHVSGNRQNLYDRRFFDILDLLDEGDLLLFNDTKVLKAQLNGVIERNSTYHDVNVNLSKKLDDYCWQILAKPGKKLSVGVKIYFKDHNNEIDRSTYAEVLEKDGMFLKICFLQHNKDAEPRRITTEELQRLLEKFGHMPIPPYLSRGAESIDDESYQTVYANPNKCDSVAAPTAGLHFTDNLLIKLKQKGVLTANVTLNVGGATLLPIKSEYIDNHVMHHEYFEICRNTLAKIKKTKLLKKRVVCVGTTSLRALESIDGELLYGILDNEISTDDTSLSDFKSETNIFIKPGYQFKLADALITNFHLPKSTLFVLICAILGIETAHDVYKHAITNQYRFFSYGDACFIEIT